MTRSLSNTHGETAVATRAPSRSGTKKPGDVPQNETPWGGAAISKLPAHTEAAAAAVRTAAAHVAANLRDPVTTHSDTDRLMGQ